MPLQIIHVKVGSDKLPRIESDAVIDPNDITSIRNVVLEYYKNFIQKKNNKTEIFIR